MSMQSWLIFSYQVFNQKPQKFEANDENMMTFLCRSLLAFSVVSKKAILATFKKKLTAFWR